MVLIFDFGTVPTVWYFFSSFFYEYVSLKMSRSFTRGEAYLKIVVYLNFKILILPTNNLDYNADVYKN
jgi:hypothetical protein